MIDRRIDGELAELVADQQDELSRYVQHQPDCERLAKRRAACTCGMVKAHRALYNSIHKMLRALGEVD